MNADDNYINQVVANHTPHITYVVQDKINQLIPHINAWASGFQYTVKLSGSCAKGTAITGTTDIDIFISLEPKVSNSNTLENVYNSLKNKFSGGGFTVREQNVSIGIEYTGLKVDIVPGIKHHILGLDHSIWKRKMRTWTKTNIDVHINYVKKSFRIADIKAIKIWRKLRKLDFPSFYLELSVIEALKGENLLSISSSNNFIQIMRYLSGDFIDKNILDPANKNNEISEELTRNEKERIKQAAANTLQGRWNQAIW